MTTYLSDLSDCRTSLYLSDMRGPLYTSSLCVCEEHPSRPPIPFCSQRGQVRQVGTYTLPVTSTSFPPNRRPRVSKRTETFT
jgi:hypothetical protein